MPMKLLTADDFRNGAKEGAAPEGTVFRLATGSPETVGTAADRTKRFVFSDNGVDLAGDSIDQKGWQTDDFDKNPVALFSHMSWDPPIGRASNVGVVKGRLVGDIEFASAEVYGFADTIYRLVNGGFLKAVSVGFKPLEWSFTNAKDRPFGIDFKKQTLLEISVCCVPCNPNALVEARSSGVDTRPLVEWAEKVLDCGDSIMVPKAELESLRKTAADKEPKRYYITSSKALTSGIDGWLKDGGALVLDEGFSVKAFNAEIVETDIAVDKAGRRISAANKALLEKAMEHHDAATKCIKDVMDNPEADDPENDDPPNIISPVQLSEEETDPVKRRLAVVRALKESLN